MKLPKSHPNSKAQKLLDISHSKKTNIIASIDLTKTKSILDILNEIGDKICAVKLHVDIIDDFNNSFIDELKAISINKKFMIIEDRKFADIGSTQLLQLTKGIYKISDWADFITIHVIAGELSLKAIEDLDAENKPAIIPVIEMSSKGSLTDDHYINKCKEFIGKYNSVVGAVCQTTNLDGNLLKFTPGINISSVGDSKGQVFNTPQYAINNLSSNFLIIGRGIYESKNPKESIDFYLEEINKCNIW